MVHRFGLVRLVAAVFLVLCGLSFGGCSGYNHWGIGFQDCSSGSDHRQSCNTNAPARGTYKNCCKRCGKPTCRGQCDPPDVSSVITFMNGIQGAYVTDIGANGVLLDGPDLYTGTENGRRVLRTGEQGTVPLIRFGTGDTTFTGIVCSECDNRALGYALFSRRNPSGNYGWDPNGDRWGYSESDQCVQHSATWIITGYRPFTPVEAAAIGSGPPCH